MAKHNSTWKIIAGGSGGQGIVTFGRILSYAGMHRKLNVSLLPTYGAEMRGGYVFCMIVFSTAHLKSPVISHADFGVFMDEYSMQLLVEKLDSSAWCLWNSSLIQRPPEKKMSNLGFPASELAEKKGDIRTANMVMLGALGKIMSSSGFPVTQNDFLTGIQDALQKKDQVAKSRNSFIEGFNLAEKVIRNG